jgi:hypothetical protein
MDHATTGSYGGNGMHPVPTMTAVLYHQRDIAKVFPHNVCKNTRDAQSFGVRQSTSNSA